MSPVACTIRLLGALRSRRAAESSGCANVEAHQVSRAKEAPIVAVSIPSRSHSCVLITDVAPSGFHSAAISLKC
jgi:hypothetical protein